MEATSASSESEERDGGQDSAPPAAGPVLPSPGQPELEDDHPPEYDTLSLPDLPPISYEEVVAAPEETAHDTLTVEAPPSYIQLFGKKKRERTRQGGRRSHTQFGHPARNVRGETPQGEQSTDGAGTANCCRRVGRDFKRLGVLVLLAAVLILVLVALPVAMIAVGFQNYHVCQSVEIPLYLIVTGFVLLGEVVMHLALFIAQKCSEDESTIKTLRRCDLLAVFLLIWLLVGSNWIFRLGVSRDREDCMNMEGDVKVVNVTNNTMLTVEVSEGLSPMENCQDCSESIYVFAGVLIICQYALALCLIGTCCSKVFHSQSSRSRSS